MKLVYIYCLFFIPSYLIADTCDDFPYHEGTNIESYEAGLKIVSTASSSVSFDDMDSLLDAKKEATLTAKSEISKFFGEEIYSDEQVNKTIEESKSMNSSGKSIDRTELVKRIKTLRNSSTSLLRGVQVLGDCYTPGIEVRVSVGLKPETINAATAGRSGLGLTESGNSKGAASDLTQNGNNKTPHKKVDGYSNTGGLENF